MLAGCEVYWKSNRINLCACRVKYLTRFWQLFRTTNFVLCGPNTETLLLLRCRTVPYTDKPFELSWHIGLYGWDVLGACCLAEDDERAGT